MKKIIIVLGILLISVIFISGCVSNTPPPVSCSTDFNHVKNVTVYQTFARQDSAANHYSPYFTTTDGEIYDINNDMWWAKLRPNMTVKICWQEIPPEKLYDVTDKGVVTSYGRTRTGSVVDIVFY